MRLPRRPRRAQVSAPSRDEIRLKVLDESAEGATGLGSLLSAREWEGRLVHKASPLDETREILRDLVESGHIGINAFRGGANERLERDAALAAIDEDPNWRGYYPEGAEVLYEVALTDSGEAEYRKLRAALESS